MKDPLETCWTFVELAASGDSGACSRFAQSYLGFVRGVLAERWRGSPAIGQLDDAVQEVFLDLFRAEGALARFDKTRAKNFRTFLFGVVAKVALRHEERSAKDRDRREREAPPADELPNADPTLSRIFDREWACSLLRRARDRLEDRARDEAARRRVEILALRFTDGLPIREIAKLWDVDAARLHKEYAKAREEFKEALYAEISYHHAGTRDEIERECEQLLDLLA